MHFKVLKPSDCQNRGKEMQNKQTCQTTYANWTVISENIDNQNSILASLQIPEWKNL